MSSYMLPPPLYWHRPPVDHGRPATHARPPKHTHTQKHNNKKQLQDKLAEARAKLEGPTDPATGRRLYAPQTGRAPAAGRNAGSLPVGEYLYAISAERGSGIISPGPKA